MNNGANLNITLSEDLLKSVVVTLKQLDVRGYDSMDRVVGLVNLFENIMAQAQQIAATQIAEAQRKAKEPGEETEQKEA